MALNPDDLLIFKVREEEGEGEEKEKKRKQAPQQQPAPAAAPQQVQQPRPAEQKPKPEPRQKQRPQQPAAPPAAPKEEVVKAVQEELEKPSPTPPQTEYLGGVEVPESGVEGRSVNVRRKSLTAKESRKLAQTLNCELHPWRKAYAICDYCQRAFCYEDIVEQGGKYYDLEDIDKVSGAPGASQAVKYSNLSLVSSLLFLLVFFVFVYFAYPLVLSMVQQMQFLGIVSFFEGINMQALLLIGDMVMVVLSIAATVLIVLNSGKSYAFSVAVGLLTVGLFAYQYINTQTLFYAAVAGISFLALVTLSYSRVAYEPLQAEERVGEMVGAGSAIEGRI